MAWDQLTYRLAVLISMLGVVKVDDAKPTNTPHVICTHIRTHKRAHTQTHTHDNTHTDLVWVDYFCKALVEHVYDTAAARAKSEFLKGFKGAVRDPSLGAASFGSLPQATKL